jgi:hypothetical protein
MAFFYLVSKFARNVWIHHNLTIDYSNGFASDHELIYRRVGSVHLHMDYTRTIYESALLGLEVEQLLVFLQKAIIPQEDCHWSVGRSGYGILENTQGGSEESHVPIDVFSAGIGGNHSESV